MKKSVFIILEWAIRINVFMKLSTYGLGKIFNGQFYLKGAIPQEIGSVPLAETISYNLAWTFFGHSRGYILFIGIAQLIGALLFLLPRTKLIGGAILLPILLNIIVVDYFFGVAYGALFSACFYVLSILSIFYWERKRLKELLNHLLIPKKMLQRNIKENALLVLGIVGVVGAIFIIEYFGIGLFGYEDR
jgi:hypothetical protein